MKPIRKLTTNQHNTLLLTHKFRFITSSLLATHRSINQSASQRTLETLRATGYLNRHYNKTYKLQGKAARYYLSKQGIKYLKENTDIQPEILNLHYKNKNMSRGYIDHSIEVYRLYLQFIKQHPDHQAFSRIELSRDTSYITPAPDLHLEDPSGAQSDIFVDLFTNTQAWVIKKRVDQYIQQHENGEWSGEYPEVHIYCDSQRQAESVEAYIKKRFEDEFIEGLTTHVRVI